MNANRDESKGGSSVTAREAETYKRCKRIAKGILSEYSVDEPIAATTLYRAWRQSTKLLQEGMGEGARKIESGETAPSVYAVLFEQAFRLDSYFAYGKRMFKEHRFLTGTVAQGKILPLYYAAFRKYIEHFDVSSDRIGLEAFFAACGERSESTPTLRDVYSFPLIFKAAVLSDIADICEAVRSKPLYADDTSAVERLQQRLSLLFFLETYDFDRAFRYSAAEQLLIRDPDGAYSFMDSKTKHVYRRRVICLSAKKHMSECAFLEECLQAARAADTDAKAHHIGAYLYPEPRRGMQYLYFGLLFSATAVLTIYLCSYSLWALLLTFPLLEAVKMLLDRSFSRFLPAPPLPRLAPSVIKSDDGALVVITALLTGGREDERLFERLEEAYLSNAASGTYFAILGDYTDNDRADSASDSAVLAAAVERIQALNRKYEPVFFLFIRPRTYSMTEGRFMGYERKRGAVVQLVTFLCGKDNAFIQHGASMTPACAEKIRFVLTLDSDTDLPLNAVHELKGILLHPLNRVRIDRTKHRVVEGFGLLQPRMGSELEATRRTAFAQLFCGSGGTELYALASFDLYQALFGRANFCGKGMFDKYAFYETICTAQAKFPDEQVLSHDILEGERLRCACVTDITFTDSFPKNELSYFRRHHRWVRGDVQNLYFVRAGEKKTRFDRLSRFKLVDNVRRESVPIFSFVTVVVAAFLPSPVCGLLTMLALLYELLPVFFDFCRLVRVWGFQCAARRFFSKGVTAGIWQSFLRFLFSVSMLAQNAWVTADAAVRAAWRMCVSRKGLLEWVTAAQSDKASDRDMLSYVQKNLFGVLVGWFLFVFSSVGFSRLLGLAWFFFPMIAYYTARPQKEKHVTPTEKQRRTLTAYAKDHWRMFESTVTTADHALPPDNIRLTPQKHIAHRTSPTNIGLYLASTLAARDFGFIDSETLCERLTDTLTTVEALPKWKGHLYNWYDTTTLEILEPRCISGVDSGNLLACLIVTAEGIKKYVNQAPELLSLVARLYALVEKAELLPLYDRSRELFSISVSVDRDGNAVPTRACYDMLMSEARTLSYIGVALRKIPKEHYAKLARPLIKTGDRLGVCSWSGTAFEYFMPPLFQPSYRGSLLYEALRFAFWAQRKSAASTSVGPVWGISESAYHAFDENGNYLYRAFGCELLSIQCERGNYAVISPYSSFLSMCMDLSLPLANLRKLKELGMYGPFGFYEAIDFTSSRSNRGGEVVRSYMAHHVGMSILACANACFDGIMTERFFSNPAMKSARELLTEKIPVDAVLHTKRGSGLNISVRDLRHHRTIAQ